MMVGPLYLEHLSDADLALLGAAGEARYDVRRDPEQLEALIDSTACCLRCPVEIRCFEGRPSSSSPC